MTFEVRKLPLGKNVKVSLLSPSVSPSEFWIIIDEDLSHFYKLKEKLLKFYEISTNLKQLNISPLVGEIIALKLSSGTWCRGRIEYKDDDGLVDVRDVDDGTLYSDVSFNKSCFYLDSLFRKLKFMAVCCRLNKVICKDNSFVWSQRAIDIFNRLVDPLKKLHVEMVGLSSNVHIVDLYSEEKINVADELLRANVASSLDEFDFDSFDSENLIHIISRKSLSRLDVVKELNIPHDYFQYLNKHNALSVGSCTLLSIDHVVTPNQMWVSIVSNDLFLLEKFQSDLNTHYWNTQSDALKFDEGLLYAIKCPVLDSWQRVFLLSVDNMYGTVLHVDHCHIRRVPLKQLKLLDNEFTKFPFQSVCCSLDVDVQHWTAQDVDYFKSITRKCIFKASIVDIIESKVIIDFQLSSGLPANIEILKFVESTRKKSSVKIIDGVGTTKSVTRSSNDFLKQNIAPSFIKNDIIIDSGCLLCLTHINSILDFYAIALQTNDQQKFKNMLKELKIFCSKSDARKVETRMLTPGLPVAALYENIWNRAVVLTGQEGEDGCVSLFFVDLGIVEKIKLTYMRNLPEMFITIHPIQSVKCSLKLPQPLKDNIPIKCQSLFKDSCENGLYKVSSSKLVDGIWLVDLLDEENENKSLVAWLFGDADPVELKQVVTNTNEDVKDFEKSTPQDNALNFTTTESPTTKSISPVKPIKSPIKSPSRNPPTPTTKSPSPIKPPSSPRSSPVADPNTPTSPNSLLPVKQSKKKIYIPDLRKDDLVQVVHINDASDFYVQKCDKKSIRIVADLIQSLNQGQLESIDDVKLNDLIVAPFSGNYFRAVIKSLIDDKLELHFVDYGNDGVDCLTSLRRLPVNVDSSLPYLALKCSLRSSNDLSMVDCEGNNDWFVNQCENKVFRVVECSKDETKNKFLVDLIELKSTESLSSLFRTHLMSSHVAKQEEVLNENIKKCVEKKDFNHDTRIACRFTGDVVDLTVENKQMEEKLEVEESTVNKNIKPPHLNIHDPIMITYINDLDHFYINDCDFVQSKLIELTQELQTERSITSDTCKPLIKGEVMVAMFEGLWHRVRVLDVLHDGRFKVKFVDYGNEEVVTSDNIRRISDDMLDYSEKPITRCSLMRIKDDDDNESVWTPEGNKWFKKNCEFIPYVIVDMKRKLNCDCEEVVYEVSLRSEEGTQSLTDYLVSKGYYNVKGVSDVEQDKKTDVDGNMMVDNQKINQSCGDNSGETQMNKSKNNDESERIHFKDLGELELTEDMNCGVTLPFSPAFFWCQHLDILMKMQGVLNPPHTIPPFPMYHPNVDELCLGFYEEYSEWYRMRIRNVSESGADVHLIDFGDKANIPLTNLLPLPHDLKEFPPMAFLCTLHDIKPSKSEKWSVEAIETFKDLVMEQLVTVNCVETINHLHMVTVVNHGNKNVAKELINLGFGEIKM